MGACLKSGDFLLKRRIRKKLVWGQGKSCGLKSRNISLSRLSSTCNRTHQPFLYNWRLLQREPFFFSEPILSMKGMPGTEPGTLWSTIKSCKGYLNIKMVNNHISSHTGNLIHFWDLSLLLQKVRPMFGSQRKKQPTMYPYPSKC